MGNRLIAKAMDDRVGCAVLIEALKRVKNPKNTLCFVFTTQEEVGLRVPAQRPTALSLIWASPSM